MKPYILYITSILLAGTLPACSKQTDPSVDKVKSLLEQVQAIVSQRPGWDEPSMAIENLHILQTIPAFAELQKASNSAWSKILSRIEYVSPSDTSKAILFVAFQSIPSDAYINLLDQAADMVDSGIINKRLFKWALFPANKNLRGVLEYNYKNPTVQKILRKAKGIYADDQNMVNYCNATLSGDTKQKAEAYLNSNPREARPNPAQ